MSTLEMIQDILVKEFDVDRARLVPDAELGGLGIDSLDVIDFMFKIEDRLGLKIEEDIPTSLVTLDDVVHYIDSLRARALSAHAPNVAHPKPVT